ncbi:MAG: alpha/beta fold hydrolase [Candidatus Hermodarchaeota archaeon]
MTELFANVNNIQLSYSIHGKDTGTPLILLHGFVMYKEFWIAQINDLSKHFKLITIDLRGCGKSDHPEESYGLLAMVDDIKGLMNHLEIEKAHIGGHSLGGMVAINFALKYPDRLSKLILIATVPEFPSDQAGLDMYKNSQISSYRAKLEDAVSSFFDKMKPRFTRNFFKIMKSDVKRKFYDIFSTEDLIELEEKGTSNEKDIINLANVMSEHKSLNKLEQIKNETLILAGEKDKHTVKSSSLLMHEKIVNSRLEILPGAHFFPLENAPEVNKIIIDFLTQA